MDDIDARMAALSARFAAQLAETTAIIEACLARRAWAELTAPCHSLAGRAGMFGQPALGDAARSVEEAIDEDAPPEEIERLTEDLLGCLRALRQDR